MNRKEKPMKRNGCSVILTVLFVLLVCFSVEAANGSANQNVYVTGGNQNGAGESAYALDAEDDDGYDPVIHWNQVFIDTTLDSDHD